MNLRGVANRATQRINPNITAQAKVCTGYTTAGTGKRTPSYADPVNIIVQIQALSKKEIEHLDALNISGTETAAYVDMQLTAVDRVKQSGGDLIVIGSAATIPPQLRGTTWLVTAVLEGWTVSGWCKVGLTRQMPA